MSISFDTAGAQIDGARDYQEDAFLINQLRDNEGQPSSLVVVADGMGGHAAGNVASNMAVQATNTHVNANYPTAGINDVLRQGVINANNSIRETISETTALEGMGCTIVSALVDARGLWWVSVGDSHLYMIRNRKLIKLNEDHSYGAFLKRMEAQGKKIKRERGMRDNMLMSALTGDDMTEIDCPPEPKPLKPGDRLILCSDGLDTLTHGKIIQISQTTQTPRECAAAMLEAVEEAQKPKQDNTTVVIVDIHEGAQQTAETVARASLRQSKAIAMAEAVELRQKFGGEARRISRVRGSRGAKTGTLLLVLALAGAGGMGGYMYYQQKFLTPPAAVPAAPAPAVKPAQPSPTPPAAPKIDMTPPSLDAPPPLVRDTLSNGSPGPQLALIPRGGFKMGDDTSGIIAELPEHKVGVAPFAIATHELTVAEYSAFLQATGHPRPAVPLGQQDAPVHGISWNDAVAYTEWLSAQAGLQYRLPTEAEWEYAASAAQEFSYAWGPKMQDKRALCRLNCGWPPFEITSPTTVGSFPPNPFGLHDTAGNVAEWIADCWNPSYQGAPDDGSAWTTGDCTQRVVRGGSFESPAKACARRTGTTSTPTPACPATDCAWPATSLPQSCNSWKARPPQRPHSQAPRATPRKRSLTPAPRSSSTQRTCPASAHRRTDCHHSLRAADTRAVFPTS